MNDKRCPYNHCDGSGIYKIVPEPAYDLTEICPCRYSQKLEAPGISDIEKLWLVYKWWQAMDRMEKRRAGTRERNRVDDLERENEVLKKALDIASMVASDATRIDPLTLSKDLTPYSNSWRNYFIKEAESIMNKEDGKA